MANPKPNARLVFSDAMPRAADCQARAAPSEAATPVSLSLQSSIEQIVADGCTCSKSAAKPPVLVETLAILGSAVAACWWSEPNRMTPLSGLSSRLLRRCASRNDNRLRRHCEFRCPCERNAKQSQLSVAQASVRDHYELYSSVSSPGSSNSPRFFIIAFAKIIFITIAGRQNLQQIEPRALFWLFRSPAQRSRPPRRSSPPRKA